MKKQIDQNRNPQKIHLNGLKGYLEKIDYEVLSLEQPWRNVIGKIRKNNQNLFFKMGTNEVISDRVFNEFKWYQKVNNKINLPFFYSFEINNKGYYKNLFWFAAEFVDGKLAAEKYSKLEIPDEILNKIIDLAIDLMNLPKIKLPRDKEFENKKVADFLLEKAESWANETNYNCQKLLNLIKKYKKNIKPAVCHGDFTPWHIIISKNGKIALIDSEHAANYVRHYDAAYFYHRLYTTNQRPDLANIFLEKYKKKLNQKLLKNFEHEFIPVLSQRIIGGYFDIVFDKKISFKLNQELEKRMIKIS